MEARAYEPTQFKRLNMEFTREMNNLLRHEERERIFSGQATLQLFAASSEVDLFEVTADHGGCLRRKMNDGQIGEWLSVCMSMNPQDSFGMPT